MLRRGFTLIELLVVITILAILAGAALPYVQNYVAESRIAKAKTDLEEIARALAVYETREGDYSKGSVADLTGRYLNKAPIDPWGSQYVIATDSGTVYSKGPDRLDTVDGKFDNISVPYQPPLALVNAKWVDKNQSGAVDFQNVYDEIHLTFSRKLSTPLTTANMQSFVSSISVDKLGTSILLASIVQLTPAPAWDPSKNDPILIGEKTVVYKITSENAFVPGQDAIRVIQNHGLIKDRTSPANYSIAEQKVLILPQ